MASSVLVGGGMSKSLFCSFVLGALVFGTACATDSSTGEVVGSVISDGAHAGGTPGFYFLPPMVPQPALAGALDPTLAPTATITRVDGGETEVVTLAAALADDHYQANWDTRAAGVEPGLYRIRLYAGGKLLGFADVRIVATGAAARNVNTDEEIPLVDGRTLPIKVWIDAGAVGNARVCAADSDCGAGSACIDYTCLATCVPGGVNDPDGDGICAGDVCPAIADDQTDLDGDGAGDACDSDADGDGHAAGADCDDGSAATHPGAIDRCGDGLDTDCDGNECNPVAVLAFTGHIGSEPFTGRLSFAKSGEDRIPDDPTRAMYEVDGQLEVAFAGETFGVSLPFIDIFHSIEPYPDLWAMTSGFALAWPGSRSAILRLQFLGPSGTHTSDALVAPDLATYPDATLTITLPGDGLSLIGPVETLTCLSGC